jgi:hypothetical protein
MDDFCLGRFDVKFLLGLALAATASATAAQAKTPIPIAVPDYERIIEAAIVICPAAFRVSERASEYIQREARAGASTAKSFWSCSRIAALRRRLDRRRTADRAPPCRARKW